MVRSFIRGSEVGALKTRVPDPVISDRNRGRKINRSKGKHPRFSMLEQYSDVLLMLETILQFSKSL